LWNLAFAARHVQLATGRDERRAIVHGLWDGARGRFGEHPGYGRTMGEYATTDEMGKTNETDETNKTDERPDPACAG
jgi:hypothetical protein